MTDTLDLALERAVTSTLGRVAAERRAAVVESKARLRAYRPDAIIVRETFLDRIIPVRYEHRIRRALAA